MTELVELIKDTAELNKGTSMFSTLLAADLPPADFVKLVEEHRRDRERRFDAGDETAALKFTRPAPAPPRQPPPPAQSRAQPQQAQQSRYGSGGGQRSSYGSAPAPAQGQKRS